MSDLLCEASGFSREQCSFPNPEANKFFQLFENTQITRDSVAPKLLQSGLSNQLSSLEALNFNTPLSSFVNESKT